jgi:hypothetical protein
LLKIFGLYIHDVFISTYGVAGKPDPICWG